MKWKKYDDIRHSITREAARLMYEEGVSEYLRAKKIACKRLLGKGGATNAHFRPHMLPSNGEIRDALLALADMMEGDSRFERLFAMRIIALEVMRALTPFDPALIGSVSTGHVRKGSDIDLHVFTDDIDALEHHLFEQGWIYERSEVLIRRGDGFQEYTHFHLQRVFPIELSVYDCFEKRIQQRSSTDGKPIVRIKPNQLEDLLMAEHTDDYLMYLQTGVLEDTIRWEEELHFTSLAESELDVL
tara:strand:+ start:25432 stop:26163 length:732 start_codon:yes stop_codon:yes gene_type:complete